MIARDKVAGWNPKVLLITSVKKRELIKELAETMKRELTPPEDLTYLFDMKVVEEDSIKDFQIIDERSWVDQKFE
jgi:hypothetical protein